MKRNICLTGVVALALLAAWPGPAHAGTLSTSVIGMFPKDVGEFAYADLKAARRQRWFAQLKDQLLPSRFRQFEQFLASAGIDPNAQVEEVAWALVGPTVNSGEQIVGVALGQFNPASAEEFFKAQKLPLARVRGYTLFAFGSGAGPNDIFFLFLDSNTAAFGHRRLLERLLDVRYGAEESLLRNEKFFPLVDEANGRGIIWAVLDQGYTRLAIQQLVPEAAQFPEAGRLVTRMHALMINIEADRSIDARFQAVCDTPETANVFANLLQAGIMLRRYQENQTNPDLAKTLEDIRINPRGERLDIRLALSEEMLAALLRRNTFAVRM